MRKTIFLGALLTLLGLSLRLVPTQAAGKAEKATDAPTTLPERHPASLSGRMDRRQHGYVDLYAPLSPAEARELAGYRQVLNANPQ